MYSKTGPEGGEGFGPYSTITVPVPEPLRRGAGGALQGQMVTAQLRIPHARGEWPSERGGYPFSLQLGPLAKHVMEIFREAGGDAAPFPDPWDTASAAAADAVPPEKFAYFPPWIANTHSLGPENNGNDGWYNDHLTGEVPAAISHLHAGLTSGDFTKIVHFAVEVPYGWDFDVALRVAPQTAPYLGTEVHGRVPPLLAIAPGVMHRGLTQGDFAAMMEGLMRLALVLNRAVVWPWVPCEAPFLRKAGATYDPVVSGHKIPWSDYIDTTAAIPNGPETISLKVCTHPCFCLSSPLSHPLRLHPSFPPPPISADKHTQAHTHTYTHTLTRARSSSRLSFQHTSTTPNKNGRTDFVVW
ncbi:hypothetical protein Vretifemale_11885 [Volvox reticuliferus]|uniref:Uncharacterized protein n=3 Tax=Volvox reticuliferus TaxID=1737510 RepID=A0A8J4CHI7_9CHLO|nr:hypothetical protein Vretifemale_11885 [Volvox reticuliferus]